MPLEKVAVVLHQDIDAMLVAKLESLEDHLRPHHLFRPVA